MFSGAQIKNAKNAYVKALEYNKNHAKALQQLGWLHYKDEDDFRSAIDYLKRASEIGEDGKAAQRVIGRERGDFRIRIGQPRVHGRSIPWLGFLNDSDDEWYGG